MNPGNIMEPTLEMRSSKPLYGDTCCSRLRESDIFHFFFDLLPCYRTAESMCFDCEKYLCDTCIRQHPHHLTYCIDNNDTLASRSQFYRQMVQSVKDEGEEMRKNFMEDKYVVVDRINVKYERDIMECYIAGMCSVNNGQKWVIVDRGNKSIKVFNGSTNTMVRYIKLSSSPCRVIEIPQVTPSHSLIGITMPLGKQIIIMDIESKPARIVHSIDTHDYCYDVSYCKDKFIVLLLNGIQVIDTSGETIHIINPDYLPFRELHWPKFRLAVHEDSETIYLCNEDTVCALSVNGQVLNTCKLPFPLYNRFFSVEHLYYHIPPILFVDKQQNVYVGSPDMLYKLSADLSQCDKIISYVNQLGGVCVMCINDTFYFGGSTVLIVRQK